MNSNLMLPSLGDPSHFASFEAPLLNNQGQVVTGELFELLEHAGISKQDPRLQELLLALDKQQQPELAPHALISAAGSGWPLLSKTMLGRLAIADFTDFSRRVREIFQHAKADHSGKQANYIPPLAEVDPEQFGLAVTTVDGQQLKLGEADVDFSLQSLVKPFNYCFALEELGASQVHRHVGREPSGQSFHARVLLEDGSQRPHNPMINAGAIMCAALIHNKLPVHLRLQATREHWARLTGGALPRYNAWMAKEETRTGDNNRALAYMMKAAGVLPKADHAVDHELRDALELYFSTCSLELNSSELASAAATLANGGVCPLSQARVLSHSTVRNCLSMMQMCGMYDASGEFCFRIGLPAKSGVGGGLILVVPGLMGICIWSPRLDSVGNSVRGLLVAEALSKVYRLHIYDSAASTDERIELRRSAGSI